MRLGASEPKDMHLTPCSLGTFCSLSQLYIRLQSGYLRAVIALDAIAEDYVDDSLKNLEQVKRKKDIVLTNKSIDKECGKRMKKNQGHGTVAMQVVADKKGKRQ